MRIVFRNRIWVQQEFFSRSKLLDQKVLVSFLFCFWTVHQDKDRKSRGAFGFSFWRRRLFKKLPYHGSSSNYHRALLGGRVWRENRIATKVWGRAAIFKTETEKIANAPPRKRNLEDVVIITWIFGGMVTNNIRTHDSIIGSNNNWNRTLRRGTKVSFCDLRTLCRSTWNYWRLRSKTGTAMTLSPCTYTQSIGESCFMPFLMKIILDSILFTEC